MYHNFNIRNSGDVEPQLFACGSSPGLGTSISESGYILLPSLEISKIALKRRKSKVESSNVKIIWNMDPEY